MSKRQAAAPPCVMDMEVPETSKRSQLLCISGEQALWGNPAQPGIPTAKKTSKPSWVCCSYFFLPDQTSERPKACPLAAQRKGSMFSHSFFSPREQRVLGKPTEGLPWSLQSLDSLGIFRTSFSGRFKISEVHMFVSGGLNFVFQA